MIIKSSFPLISSYISPRIGEIKLGQVLPSLKVDIHYIHDLNTVLANTSAKYVVVGISEDIGVRANYGKGGTEKAYDCFLKYWCNTQKNQWIDEQTVFVLGEIFVEDLLTLSQSNGDIQYLRNLTQEVDIRVFPVIQSIVAAGKVPIVIGGGHNNAYGNIKGASLAMRQAISVLNIDPHADFRIEEGRHSGNGFRYAMNHGHIAQYAMWGLHKAYNNSSILETLSNNDKFKIQYFDEIISDENRLGFQQFIETLDKMLGIEVDLDSIKDMPTSAITPVGFSEELILNYLSQLKKNNDIIYYHFCEGTPNEQNQYKVGKFLSYIVNTILCDR